MRCTPRSHALALLLALAVPAGCGNAPPTHDDSSQELTAAAPVLDPEPVGAAIAKAIADGAFPGAVIEVGRSNGAVYSAAFGTYGYGDEDTPMQVDTVFDLASVTKVMATTTIAMRLFDRGLLDLDEPVNRRVPAFRGGRRGMVTPRHLLTHSAGLPAWRRFFVTHSGREAYLEAICTEPLATDPGARYRYSDLGMMLLAAVLESAGGAPLEDLYASEVARPLGLEAAGYNPPRSRWSRCAPTERCAWRGRMLQGEVHDENAFAAGGVAGHAGLFATAADLGTICRMLLAGGLHGEERYLRAETVARFTARQDLPPGSYRALGWGSAAIDEPSCGPGFSRRSFGHTGFTGTSVWCDPERDLYVVLLTNRVHPTRENPRIKAARPAIHTAVLEAIRGGN